MGETSSEFIAVARAYLRDEYLPKIERCVERLDDEQLWRRPNAQSNSVGNLLLHLEGNSRQWILAGVCNQPDTRARQAEFDERGPLPREAMLGRLRATLQEIDAALARLDSASLLERRRIQGYDVSVLAAVFHVVEHFLMHTGQVILLTKALTGSGLAFYDVSGGEPRRNWLAPGAREDVRE